jgi:single stranded DNA-binding protein
MLNRVTLIGRLGRDAEVTSSYTRFGLATTQSWKDRATGEWKEKTEWHNVTLFAEKALPKGALVWLEGSIAYSEKDGKYYTNIIASSLRWLNKPPSEAPVPDEAPAERSIDGVPF